MCSARRSSRVDPSLRCLCRGASRVFAWLVAGTLVLRSDVAHAESASDLLQRGKDEVQAGLVDKACATFSQAEALAPDVDSIGLVAACHEKQGKLATAYAEYLVTADRAAGRNDDRQNFARAQAAKLSPSVPRLTIRPASGDRPHVVVAGKEVGPDLLGTPIMVDPGTVEIIASEPGGGSWNATVTIAAGAARTIDIPLQSTWSHARAVTPPRYAMGPPAAAIVAGAVGVAGLGVLAGGGVAALVLNHDAEATNTRLACGHIASPGACASAAGKRDAADRAAVAADVGLGVGAAGIATAAVLWAFHVGAREQKPNQAATVDVRDVALVPNVSGAAVVVVGSF